MDRRQILKSAAALAALGVPLEWISPAEGAPLKRLGKAEAFSFATLKGKAQALSVSPFIAPSNSVPEAIAKLNWDQWQSIQFDQNHSLWRDDDLRYQARFFHLGFTARTPVRIFEVENGQAQEVAYDPDMFNYAHSGVNGKKLPKDLGFAGFRVNYHSDWVRDVVAFQGASYFRAVSGTKQYGQSARGLAINCGEPYPEEFPVFTEFWLERPARDSNILTVYALLDSPSTTGAYRFDIDVGDTLTMDIDVALYPRKPIERIGIAPLTSMFLVGENDRRIDDDWRPEIHDTDGLQLWTGNGDWQWRPLVNPRNLRVNSYFDNNPRGFGLMQRDRNFDHYQDDGVFYDRRPSVWVEPKGEWGKGAVMLVEIPTTDETFDNIVAFWHPTEAPPPGKEFLISYKLYWCTNPPYSPRTATVAATRTGIGGVVGQKHAYFSWRFAIDFAGGDFTLLGDNPKIVPVIEASRGTVEITSARPLWAINGWRAMFDLRPTDDSVEPINLRCYLALDGQPLTETWVYQWTPPPPSERKF